MMTFVALTSFTLSLKMICLLRDDLRELLPGPVQLLISSIYAQYTFKNSASDFRVSSGSSRDPNQPETSE